LVDFRPSGPRSAPRVRHEGAPATRPPPSASAAPAKPAAHRERGQNTDTDAELIVKYPRSHPGTSGEAARNSLGLEKNRWNTCVYRALRDGKIRKDGERRSTRYWAAG